MVKSSAAYVLVVIGIVAAGFNLRPGVTGLSPLLDTMAQPLGLTAAFLAVIGMLPPLIFGIAGFLTPRLTIRWGAVSVISLAMIIITVGLAIRSVTGSPVVFLLLTAFALIGMGIGNVVIPPLVKGFFPTRVGLFSTIHVAALQFGTFIPPVLAVPLAQGLGWRGSLAVWSLAAAIPAAIWLLLWIRRVTPETTPSTPVVSSGRYLELFRSGRAWALMLMTGITSFNNFILFTWLPMLFVGAGLSESFGGAMLSLVTAIPFLLGLVLPMFAERVHSPVAVVLGFSACLAAGYLGLWLAPAAAPVLWTVLLGLGISTFPLALTLISLRSSSAESAAALSGFVQGLGYCLAATGPLIFGFLVQSNVVWPAFALVLGSVAVKAFVAARACQPGAIS